jgi:hypothetical protein
MDFSPFSHHGLPVMGVAKQLILRNVNVIASRPKIQPEKYYYTKFILEQAMKIRGGSKIQLYSFFNLGARLKWVVNATLRPLYPREGDMIPILK